MPELRALRAAFEVFEHAGLRARLDGVAMNRGGDHARLDGDVFERSADKVGEFSWALATRAGELRATFLSLHLHSTATRRGFGVAFEARCCEQLAGLGVSRVLVHATQVGSWVWAHQGYEYCDADVEPRNLLATALPRLEVLVADGRMPAGELAALEAAVAEGALSSPQQAAAFGRERAFTTADGVRSWAGRELLMYNAWYGEKRLRPSQRLEVQDASAGDAGGTCRSGG